MGKNWICKRKKITGTKIVTVAQGKESQKVFKENTTLIDDYGNNVKVPSGFKISSDSETAVTAGVVIEDVSAGNNYTKGSQFVWIPVGNVKTNNDGSMEQIELGRYNFDKTSGKSTIVQSAQNWNDTSNAVEKNGCKELESSTFGNTTAKNLEDFIKKVQTTLGFYIGRYEAGDAYATDSHRQSNSPKTNPVICSSSVYPYSYVTQPQAASLAQNMYNNENFESDLINSYVWDTTIVYIQKFSGDSNYSIQNGESDGNYKKCGSYILKNVDDGDEEKDVRCNIYDMAGSMQEFTTETSVDGKIKVRGGTMASNSSMYTSMYTGIQTINTAMHIVAFRPCLYL